MSPKCKQYKDVFAAPGSDLYQAIIDRDDKKAKQVYDDAKRREQALVKQEEKIQ